MFQILWPVPQCMFGKDITKSNLSTEAKAVKLCRLSKEDNWVPDVVVFNAYEKFKTIVE